MKKPNPFKPDGLVKPGMFVGRLPEIETIEAALRDTSYHNPRNILITGERGIGKSSLLQYTSYLAQGLIKRDDAQSEFLVSSVLLSKDDDQSVLTAKIIKQLLESGRRHNKLSRFFKGAVEFAQRLEAYGVSLRAGSNQREDAITDILCDALLQFRSVPEDELGGIAIMIDEADQAKQELDLGTFLKIVTEKLSHVGFERVMFCLSGLTSVRQVLSASHKSANRIFHELHLDRLSKSESGRVVNMGLREVKDRHSIEVTILQVALDRLVYLSEGYPSHIQQFAYSAYEEDSDNEIDDKDVENGLFGEEGALNILGKQFFEDMYYTDINTDQYRKILSFMAQYEDEWIPRPEIIKNLTISDKTVDNGIKALKRKGIIFSKRGKSGEYRLCTRAFRQWLIMNAP